jgi:hypothetical protein
MPENDCRTGRTNGKLLAHRVLSPLLKADRPRTGEE